MQINAFSFKIKYNEVLAEKIEIESDFRFLLFGFFFVRFIVENL